MRTDIRNLTIEEYLSSFDGERRINYKYKNCSPYIWTEKNN